MTLWLTLLGCPFPDFDSDLLEADTDTDTDADSDTDADTDTDTDTDADSDTDTDTDPPVLFDVVPLGNVADRITPGLLSGPTGGAFGSYAVGSANEPSVTWYENGGPVSSVNLQSPPLVEYYPAPVGVVDPGGEEERLVVSIAVPDSGVSGFVELMSPPPTGDVIQIAAPNGELRFGEAAAVLADGTLAVAALADDGVVYHFDALPSDQPAGWWQFNAMGAGEVGRSLRPAVDDQQNPYLLVGSGGDAGSDCTLMSTNCDTATVWGLYPPDTANRDPNVITDPLLLFRFRTDGVFDNLPRAVGGANAVVADLDADGCTDLVVGAPYDAQGAGQVQVVECIEDQADLDKDLVSSPGFAAVQGLQNDFLGGTLAVLDGFLVPGEVAVAVAATSLSGADQGTRGGVYVFRGPDLIAWAGTPQVVDRALTPKPYVWIQPPPNSFDAGVVLTNAGDLNGDQRDDLVVGAFDSAFIGESWVLRAGTPPLH